MSSVPAKLLQTLQQHHQHRLLACLQLLPPAQQMALSATLADVDFDLLQATWLSASQPADDHPSVDRAALAQAPSRVVRQPVSAADHQAWAQARSLGEQAISAGTVAVITVAGGQGTRLGFEHPKGLFPIGPVTDRTLFQIFAEQILARRRRHSADLPWCIMTSDATHEETVAFFQQHQYFGLTPDSLHFFRQGSLPAMDAATGQLLLAAPGQLALSPDGHGGLVTALARAGLLELLQARGVQHLYYHQVDNPTAIVADPALLGFHIQQQSQATTCVVCKTSPTERMGVLVDLQGRTEIIEYSELTAEQAAGQDQNGQWIFWAGNTAIHVFDRQFLASFCEAGRQLPLHIARKQVPSVDETGQPLPTATDGQPNAIKLERFIFDALPAATNTLIVEGHREREFNPVKNKSGSDSADTCRAALSRIAAEWLQITGLPVDPQTVYELSPLVALDVNELVNHHQQGTLPAITRTTAGCVIATAP